MACCSSWAVDGHAQVAHTEVAAVAEHTEVVAVAEHIEALDIVGSCSDRIVAVRLAAGRTEVAVAVAVAFAFLKLS